MSAMPPNLIVPEEDTLNELYETVLRGFLPSPSPSTESTYSRGAYSAYPESAIDAESPVAEASGSTRHQFGKLCSGPLERVPDKVAANTPPSLSRSTSAQAAPLPNGISSSPAPARRRPLPPTPASSSRTPLQPPQIQPPPIFRPGPSSYDPPRTQQRPLSRKLSRNYSQSNLPQVVAPETTDEDGAGPSSTENEAEVPTSPTTEYPDHGAFLPSYYQSAHEDPNASASLEFAPPVGGDYTELPPPQTYEESVISDGTSIHQRYHGVESGERWNSGPEASTVLSGEYPMLQRPRSDASDFPRNIYEEPQEEPPQPYQPDPPEWNRNLRHSNDVVDIGPNPVRGNTVDSYSSMWDAGEPGDLDRRNTNVIRLIANFESRMHLELHEEEEEDPYEVDERRFVNMALLSNLAVQLRDKVPRGTHVKGSIPYPRAFTGKDIVSTLHSIIQRELLIDSGISHADRRAALLVARSLHGALFFYEVEWGARVLQDGVEDVYMFLDDQEGGSEAPIERAELPTGIVTVLTKCYSASCDGPGCYAYSCPRRGLQQLPSISETPVGAKREEWTKKVPQQVLASLSESEINRQTIIHKLISKEQQYIQDLDILEAVFINPLRLASPPVMTPLILEEFIEEVFGNILELRECNRRLLDVMYVRQREQYPVIQSVGDIFLGSATEFRTYYPDYVGHHPLAEKRMKEELEHNPEFRLFIEKCSRELSSRSGASGTPRLDLKHYLNRPAEHLQKYPVLLDAVYRETQPSNPDGDYLAEAIAAIQNLQDVARLRTFQSAMGKGSTAKCEWHDLLSPDMRQMFTEEESKRQSVIFELIKGEMAYVRDLENIETMYVRPLRNAEPPIIPSDRLEQFLMDVFHNYHELYGHHRRLVDNLHEIQREEHPRIRSITAAVFDAVLNFRESYMEYIPNYPIAAYRIDDEMANNEAFRQFVNHTTRHPDAHRLDMKNFINRPIPRLLRYELLLKSILSETPPSHRDRQDIPPVIELIKALGKETEPGVASSKQKVELWKHNSNLVFKTGEYVDMDLLNEQRSLIHTGKLLRQPDSGLEWSGWTELFVMLFDNYLVMTKPRERDGVIKYHVYRRPIPLDLLSLVNFTDASVHRNTSILRSLRNGSDTSSVSSRQPENGGDSRSVFPCTIHHNGRLGGPYILYAESSAARTEWRKKLEEALGLRKVVQESNKVFEIESLSVDTFLLPTLNTGPNSSVWHDGTLFTGKVTCSVPFNTPDGRGLVAIGCAEGVWIGYRHDSRSLRRVLHLKMVTQCAILEDFGLFIVLADKVLYAYHLEALVPTTPGSIHASQTPQRIHGKDVHFFSVGVLHQRTLVIYMKKRGNNDCVFNAVEPVIDKINERPKASGGGLLGLKKNKTEWFRHYKDFSIPDAHDLIFLKAKIAVLCAKGFMIMDLIDYKSVTIPQRDDPNFPYLAKRCDSCRPLGMFRSSDEEFLLCYDEFGLFVDKHGNPNRQTGTIEWEGTADRVAMHAPYVLLFDTRFIEIRHIETGRLVQIIPGNDVRCVWDGRNLDGGGGAGGGAVVPAEGNEEKMVQEPCVHAVMNMAEPAALGGGAGGGGRQMRGIMQHVFELFPTIPLYLPGSLASPSTAPYFPLSFSPPRSPPLRSHHI